jgi:putative tricarboxylic transport membrane protein
MSQGAESSPSARRGPSWIRAPQDFWGGLALIALALFAIWASGDLPGMRGFAFGPGTAPRLFAGILAAFGALIVLFSVLMDGPPIGRYAIRGPFWITVSLFVFATLIRPVGLIAASFATFIIAGFASHETRWLENGVVAVVMTAFCVGLFVYLLNLPFQLWPRF